MTTTQRRTMWAALVLATAGAILAALSGAVLTMAASAALATFAATSLHRDELPQDHRPRW